MAETSVTVQRAEEAGRNYSDRASDGLINKLSEAITQRAYEIFEGNRTAIRARPRRLVQG